MQGRPYAEELRSEMQAIAARIDELLTVSSIRPAETSYGGPEHQWDDPSPAVMRMQMKLIPAWDLFAERYRLLFPHPTPEVAHLNHEILSSIRRWIIRESGDWSIPPTIQEAKASASEWFGDLGRMIDLVAPDDSARLMLVPDTNSLIRNPDLASYARAVNCSEFVVTITPTVLAELDMLKDRGERELAEKAQGFIRRLKGLRDKGRLRDGVKLTRGITVRTSAVETHPANVLAWLDANVRDDRILASALAIQSEHPGDTVVLVTSDLNLQNKADSVGLPYVETPSTDADLAASLRPQIERRGVNERHWVVIVTNDGPRHARSVKYQVSTSPDCVGPRLTSGLSLK
jgi:rRNA-processing protein FCF1